MNNENLKNSIEDVIKNNGLNLITGDVMQDALISIINQFGSGSVFAGFAVPTTNPVNTDVNMFYMAKTPGTYVNFGGYVLEYGKIAVLNNKTGVWVAENFIDVKSIENIEKTATSGLVDTYTITYTDGSTFDFEVTNGSNAQIPVWSATDFAVSAQAIKENIIYIAPNGASATDIPGESDKWETVGLKLDVDGGAASYQSVQKIEKELKTFGIDKFIVPVGSNGYYSTDFIDVKQGDIIKTFTRSEYQRLEFYNLNNVKTEYGMDGTPVSELKEFDFTAPSDGWVKIVSFLGTYSDISYTLPGIPYLYKLIDTVLKPYKTSSAVIFIPNYGQRSYPTDYGNDSNFTYVNHALLNGKLVTEIILDVAQAGELTVLKGKNIGQSNYTSVVATKINLETSKTTYPVNIQLQNDESLLFGVPGDTGLFWFSNEKANDKAGGLLQRNNTSLQWLSGPTLDLRVGLVIREPYSSYGSKTIDDLYIKSNSLNKKKISIISDSIGTYSGIIPPNFASFYPNFDVNSVEKTWWKKLAFLVNGEILTNNSYSGSKVSSGGDGSLQTRLNIIDSNTEITFLMMGVNDHYSNVPLGDIPTGSSYNLNEFSGAYKNAIDRNLEYYPNSRFICLTPMRYYSTIINGIGLTIDDYADRIIEICKVCGVEYIDMRQVGFSLINQSNFLGDLLHPKEAGMQRMAEFIKSKI